MSPDKPRAKTEDLRRARLAASLRENLKRRKAQQRARAAEAAVCEAGSADVPRSGELTSRTPGRRRSCDRLDLG